MMSLTRAMLVVCPLVWLIDRWRRYRIALAMIYNRPGLRLMFGATSVLGNLLPTIPYISPGRTHAWYSKRHLFGQTNSEVYGVATAFPPSANLVVSDLRAIKQLSYTRNGFEKNTSDYEVLGKFGSNLLVTKGEEWKRQRRICAPAFSDRNNHLVWVAATKYTKDMLDDWSPGNPVHIHDVCEQITLPLSICVISKAGFGRDIPWREEAVPDGHKMSFKEAVVTSSSNLVLLIVLPDWAWGLSAQWRRVKTATHEFKAYLREMIRTCRELKEEQAHEMTEKNHDLLSQLIYARDADDNLTEEELIGNVFIFMFAGHESTAHTLGIMLAMLALYPHVQEELVKHVREVRREDGELTYSHMNKLNYAMAVVYETLRLFPMATVFPKRATADVTLNLEHQPDGQKVQLRASTPAYIAPVGLHYNPSYWDDPEEFVPARFIDPHWNRDAFIPFSLGPRACIGRRFAETTLVATLVTITSKYHISVDESIFKAVPGESMLERRTRLVKPEFWMTLTPPPIPLVFTPRK